MCGVTALGYILGEWGNSAGDARGLLGVSGPRSYVQLHSVSLAGCIQYVYSPPPAPH